MESRIQNILEAAPYDPDKLPAPKEYFPPNEKNDQALKEWYEERDRERRRKARDQTLEDY